MSPPAPLPGSPTTGRWAGAPYADGRLTNLRHQEGGGYRSWPRLYGCVRTRGGLAGGVWQPLAQPVHAVVGAR